MTTISRTQTFEILHCWNCGIAYGVTTAFYNLRQSDKKTFHCPNGHGAAYSGESDKDRAQRLAGQLDQERTRLQQERQRVAEVSNQLAISQRTRKAVSTRLRKVKARVGHGVCPCCNRTFEQLARHMATNHPHYAKSIEEA